MTDEQHDRTFDMGCGSLRSPLIHVHEAMYWWHHVCHGNEDPPEPPARATIDALAAPRMDYMVMKREEIAGS